MEEIAISRFKATCLAVLERVRQTRRPVLVTRFGQPVAEVIPPSAPPHDRGWIGVLRATGEITGDIVAPASESSEWEALDS